MQPAPGVEYPLQLGGSLLSRGEQGAAADEYCTLRYDFKPASAGRAAAGQMDVQLGNQKVRWRRRRRQRRQGLAGLRLLSPHPCPLS